LTRVTFTGPPETSLPGYVCLVCLMLAKAAELAGHAPEWHKLRDDGRDGPVQVYPWRPGRYGQIREALVEGLSNMLPTDAGLVPLCWDHLASIETQTAPRVPPAGRIPPGLLKGRG
jgi:hypothetical protein